MILEEDMHFVCGLSGDCDAASVAWFAARGVSMIAMEAQDALAVLPI